MTGVAYLNKSRSNMKNSRAVFSIDVERDLHTNQYEGIKIGLTKAEKIFSRYNIKPTLFITTDCLEKYPRIFLDLKKKGWEISFHGLTHRRFDSLSIEEKNREFQESLKIFRKFKIMPRGFRAPQHSIDKETLSLLEKYKFEYDSSYTPLNLLQLVFFPKKLKLWIKNFFSPRNNYNICSRLQEKPSSSFILPFTSLTLRILPKFLLYSYFRFIKLLYRSPMFYCHSWDFISIEKSRIEKIFPSFVFQKKLENVLKWNQEIS